MNEEARHALPFCGGNSGAPTRTPSRNGRARPARPYFAKRLAAARVNSLADLEKLPLTLKENLRAASPFGSIAVPKARALSIPRVVRHDRRRGLELAHPRRLRGLRPPDQPVRPPFRAGKHRGQQVPLLHQRAGPHRQAGGPEPRRLRRLRQFPHGRLPLHAPLDLMRKLRTTVLTCLPTEAALLGAAALAMCHTGYPFGAPDHNWDPAKDFNLRAIGAAGELLTTAAPGGAWRRCRHARSTTTSAPPKRATSLPTARPVKCTWPGTIS